jgi:Flp pilus assembly protein TadD
VGSINYDNQAISFKSATFAEKNDIAALRTNSRRGESGGAMMEIRIKSPPWPSGKASTTTVTPAASHPVDLLRDTHMRLCEADELRQHRKFDHAQKICESLIREHPGYMAAHHTLGLIHAAKRNFDRAFDHLSRAVMLNPRSWMTLTALASVCLELRATDMAALALDQARAIKPRDATVLVMLGEIYTQEHEFERAKEAFREAIALEDDLYAAIMGLGFACEQLGQNAEAVELFKSLLKRGMSTLGVLLAFSSVPSAFINVDLLAELDKLSRNQTDEREFEESAAFIRARALEKAGRLEEAWQHLVPVNRAIFLAMQEDLRGSSQKQTAALTALQGDRSEAVVISDSRQPISLFILGPSRSGKSTMEQLVATLDGVKRGYENPSVEKAIRRTFQQANLLESRRIGLHIGLLPPQLYPQCRDFYLEELAGRVGSARVFTNSNPSLIYEAQLMASVFPNVRFILLRRNLEDTILRMYQYRYRTGNAYSYDLKAARDYVVWYHQMIDLMAAKFPDIVRIIDYEGMIANPAAAVRVAAELCGLRTTDGPLPDVGDDRGCAKPYYDFIRAELSR